VAGPWALLPYQQEEGVAVAVQAHLADPLKKSCMNADYSYAAYGFGSQSESRRPSDPSGRGNRMPSSLFR
jgi:hypothetical protein